jgi:hypothetical protein
VSASSRSSAWHWRRPPPATPTCGSSPTPSRASGTGNLARHLAERFGLREGLDIQSAADVLWTLTGPEIAQRLVVSRGWSWDRYEHWFATTAAEALLGPDTTAA